MNTPTNESHAPQAAFGCKRAGGFVDHNCMAMCDCDKTMRFTPAPQPPVEGLRAIADYLYEETTKLDAPISMTACLVLAKRCAALASPSLTAGWKWPEDDDRPLPTYGQIPWKQLGRDVMDARIAQRQDYEFDPTYYPGHQSVTLNFNSLARIVDKYRYYGMPPAPATLIEQSEKKGS